MTTTAARSAGFGILNTAQGLFRATPFLSDDADPGEPPTIMLELKPVTTPTTHWALDADEARALAAELVAMADDLDAGRWPEPVATNV